MIAPSSPNLALHEISLYNTGRVSPEKIIAAFAARVEQFERISADIGAENDTSRAQHHLIVGQRGMGKTMLLARLAAELRTQPGLATRFIPLVFAEEQYSVDRLSKFWLNCLDSLADAREAVNDRKSVDEIDATVAHLQAAGMRAVKNDQPFANEVYEAFIGAARASGQRPVLFVDNLQLVFERLDEAQQHSLRELLMRPGSPILVGASPSPPPQSQNYGAAFYDHFKVHYLRPLDEEEMRSLLLHLADAAQREDVRQRVLQHPARLAVLRQLTGGNPRTTLLLFFLYSEDFAPSVFGDLEGLLDRVTPLYKARFEELTAQQQVIASAIANHWDPVTAAKLATSTGLPASTITAQLDRLEKLGVIERTELFADASNGYMLAERFFNIWFLMRSASRRQRREVEFLTRFLESFYEPADRNRIARQLMGEDHFTDRYVWSCAVAASLSEPATAEELIRHTELSALREEAREARVRLRELIDFDSLPTATLAFDDLRKKLMSLVPEKCEVTPEEFTRAVLGDRALFMSGDREKLAARSGRLSNEEIQGVIEASQKAKSADEQIYSKEAAEWFTQRIASGQIRSVRDVEDWNRAFRQASGKTLLQLMVNTLPGGFGVFLDHANMEGVSAVLRPDDSATLSAWLTWGASLHIKFARFREAETAYRRVMECHPEESVQIESYESKVQSEIEQSTRSATTSGVGNDRISRLQQLLGAIANKRQVLSCIPRLMWVAIGTLNEILKDYDKAETAFLKSIQSDPHYVDAWIELGKLYYDRLGRFSEAAEAFDNVLRLDNANELAHQSRLFLRRDYEGEGLLALPMFVEFQALANQRHRDSIHLHEALFAAYERNWDLAAQAFSRALAIRTEGFSPETLDDWHRASAVLLHLNYGAELIALLDQCVETVARWRPWVEAIRAVHAGDRRALLDIAPEIRITADTFYDEIDGRLKLLPDKTRRRLVHKGKRVKAKR